MLCPTLFSLSYRKAIYKELLNVFRCKKSSQWDEVITRNETLEKTTDHSRISHIEGIIFGHCATLHPAGPSIVCCPK